MAYSKRIEELIKTAMVDGAIDATEEKVLRKAAKSEGLDPDELIMNVRARVSKKGSDLGLIGNFHALFEDRRPPEVKSKEQKQALFIGAACLLMVVVSMYGLYLLERGEQGTDGNYYNSYIEAAQHGEFTVAHTLVNQTWQKYKKVSQRKDHEDQAEQLYKQYMTETADLFVKEMTYLIGDGSEEASNRVAFLLVNLPTEYDANAYSDRCNDVFNLAIITGNEYLAKKVLAMYKQNEAKNQAIKKYKQAVKEGAFK